MFLLEKYSNMIIKRGLALIKIKYLCYTEEKITIYHDKTTKYIIKNASQNATFSD